MNLSLKENSDVFLESHGKHDVLQDWGAGAALISSGGQIVCIFSQLCFQQHQAGSLKSATVGGFTTWKLANATDWDFSSTLLGPSG